MPHTAITRRTEPARNERGQAAVEFALIAPVLVVLLLGIVQVGIAFSHYMTITDAARVGARRAILLRVSNVTPADVTQAVQSASAGLNVGVSVSDATDPTFSTQGSTVAVTVTYPYSINLLGWVVTSGTLTSTTTDPLE